jgi:CRP-like cAMP-binding protein
MEHPTGVGNRLLAALPPADFGLLAPHLRNVSLERDAMLVRSGDRIEQIYFPRSGTIAFMLDMPNGQTVATAVIGNEGSRRRLDIAGTLALSDDGGGTHGRHLLEDLSSTIFCGPQPQ